MTQMVFYISNLINLITFPLFNGSCSVTAENNPIFDYPDETSEDEESESHSDVDEDEEGDGSDASADMCGDPSYEEHLPSFSEFEDDNDNVYDDEADGDFGIEDDDNC